MGAKTAEKGCQKTAYEVLKAHLSTPLDEFLRARMTLHFPALQDTLEGLSWDNILLAMKRLPSKCAAKVFKTLAGGWTTSSRMNEAELLSCYFCGGSVDDWRHYACCPQLWSVISEATGSERVGPDAVHYLGLVGSRVEVFAFLPTVVAFDLYHDCKHKMQPQLNIFF